MLPEGKALVLQVDPSKVSESLLREAEGAGIQTLITEGSIPGSIHLDRFRVFEISEEPGPDKASWVRIASAEDVRRAIDASSRDQAFVVVECFDWRIIPLENLIAEFRRRGRKLYAFADSKEQIETSLTVLESGVDGVVIPISSMGDARGVTGRAPQRYSLEPGRVTRILDAGLGERACVDTTSKLEPGEGMLIGSKGGFFFLVHGETIPSAYIPTRPFRVNAGALHSYTLSLDDKTRYLSELEAPDRVAVVNIRGNSRAATVGRVKIERRPLVLVEASAGSGSGTVILQMAETIRLVRPDGSPVSVTDLKIGDEVLVHAESFKARHFGGGVDEHIEEK